ncbi:PREDICTED: RING-H2 finger protein ATL43-like isoform X2 [Lupinus angustifolius]|uniref:RING-H2 finger protein ATL43-like isoform X2 n=1 Tax=Lupinus angustifolius TaxID=3871 RepID=UPI00092F6E3B|nr:PREDICTED: RING-H2 finger protein ATL43-like isoform X2 [Lupinus angustifolius]
MPTSLSFNTTFSFYSFLFLFLFLLNFQHSKQQQTPFHNLNNTLKSPPPLAKTSSSFKPEVAVIVAVLTTMFSLTFLLLLYIKHCNNVSNHNNNTTSYRKNSGIDRSVIESLPIFRFGSLMGQKHGLDCAVCLNKFEPSEVLRLLPKCKHAFHVECVDTWLDAHSTCPLCRYRVDPEDIFLLHHQEHVIDIEKETNPSSQIVAEAQKTRRISGRHSSVEKGGIFQIITELKTASFFRRSLDSATARKRNENGVVGERKDEMLMVREMERRIEQRIIVCSPRDERWSDVEPLDLLYLTSEMIISGGGIETRSVSEMTGLKRFISSDSNNNRESGGQRHQQRR